MYLACELAKQGMKTAIVGEFLLCSSLGLLVSSVPRSQQHHALHAQHNAGLDMPIVNNYGVWLDEFRALGMDHTLERSWPRATCFFGEGQPVQIERPYGRVCRRKLRAHLLDVCRTAGVTFLPGDVTAITVDDAAQTSHITTREGDKLSAR
jgi:hypothetical protein